MSDQPSSDNKVAKKATAGLRGASWDATLVPSTMRTQVHVLRTEDGAQVIGYLHASGNERTVAFIMHPRELLVSHYLVPYLVNAGIACWVQGSRTPGNDLRLEHETALLDVAAGMVHLRNTGFARIVLLGNSGGAGLFAFYNQQAGLPQAGRLNTTPAGRPSGLDTATMPEPDGFVFVAPHPGQGKLLLNLIDPSVSDEADPFSIDQSLSAFNPDNGFRRAPESASYKPDFLARYRASQKARVQRIDEFARGLLADKQQARKRAKEKPSPDDLAKSAYAPIFHVWRTDADPRCFDLSLDPSDRRWGTVWGANPMASNFGSVGFARVCTPESWLSTWSGISSRASFESCGGTITQPTIMLEYTGDNTVFPSDLDSIYAAIGTSAKTRLKIRGNHHGQPLADGEPSGQTQAGKAVVEWFKANING